MDKGTVRWAKRVKTNPVEGDLLEDLNGMIFDVKGLVHPPNRVVAFPRFIPDPFGDRWREGSAYRKVYSLSVRFEFLKANFPHYVVYDPVFDEELCEVPLGNVKRFYKPIGRLREVRYGKAMDEVESDALRFVELLKDHTNAPWNKFGISGSLLVKLHTPNSDIDLVVYGSGNCRDVYEALMALRDPSGIVRPYSVNVLRKLFRFRFQDTRVSFKDFVRTESRKVLHGKFGNRDYFIRFVKDLSEINREYGVIRYKNVGYARIKAEVEDDSESIFTPCSYKVKNVKFLKGAEFPINEVVSFRGRFCEQAKTGEVIVAQGKVERVTDSKRGQEYFRLLLGGRPSDYMILKR